MTYEEYERLPVQVLDLYLGYLDALESTTPDGQPAAADVDTQPGPNGWLTLPK